MPLPTKEFPIELKGLIKTFGEQEVLRGVDLMVEPGKVTTIIGKSGTGKSVLLKCLSGLMHPDQGEVIYRGTNLTDPHNRDYLKDFHKGLSYMFQHNALFDSLTVLQNIALPLSEKTRLPRTTIQQRVEEMVDRLDLEQSILTKYPSQISGGMQKRVALARALITEPHIVLFDEPTTGLDPVRKNTVYEMMKRYQERFGFTLLMVSHDIPDVLCISDFIAILDRGKVRFYGTPESLKLTQPPFPPDANGETFGLTNPFKTKILAYLT